MISEDISNGRERVKVPAINELNDQKPTAFGVKYLFILTHVHQCDLFYFFDTSACLFINLWYFLGCLPVGMRFRLSSHCSCTKLAVAWIRTLIIVLYKTCEQWIQCVPVHRLLICASFVSLHLRYGRICMFMPNMYC